MNPCNMSNLRNAYLTSIFTQPRVRPLWPLLRLKDPMIQNAAEAGTDVVRLAMNEAYLG